MSTFEIKLQKKGSRSISVSTSIFICYHSSLTLDGATYHVMKAPRLAKENFAWGGTKVTCQ